MEQYKKEFIDFMLESKVLKFGDFTLKSGRKSPFFMNAGGYVTGNQLKRLGEYYAKAIVDQYGKDFDVLFGPAYKGIPLAVATTIALDHLYGMEVRYCSDRKEEKDHGADKGSLVTIGGHDPRITRSGYFIRKFKFDELPQLINVFIGDMSLVGPRPEVRHYVDYWTPEQMHVLDVRPGITDPASIKFRNENELMEQAEDPEKYYIEVIMQEKLKLYLEYVNNHSFFGDIGLIFKTFWVIVKER